MKRIFLFSLLAVLSVIPAWADDLTPVPQDQAIREYLAIEKAGGQIDPMNHETWKLYIRALLLPKGGFNPTPYGFLCSLVPGKNHKRYFLVAVKINNLYNFFDKVPQVGDVIAVDGHITEFLGNSHLEEGPRVHSAKIMNLYPENAKLLPPEPQAEETPVGVSTPSPIPAVATSSAGASPANPTLPATPSSLPPGVGK